MKKHYLCVCMLACASLHGQNVVADWATIVQPAINTPPKPRPFSSWSARQVARHVCDNFFQPVRWLTLWLPSPSRVRPGGLDSF